MQFAFFICQKQSPVSEQWLRNPFRTVLMLSRSDDHTLQPLDYPKAGISLSTRADRIRLRIAAATRPARPKSTARKVFVRRACTDSIPKEKAAQPVCRRGHVQHGVRRSLRPAAPHGGEPGAGLCLGGKNIAHQAPVAGD